MEMAASPTKEPIASSTISLCRSIHISGQSLGALSTKRADGRMKKTPPCGAEIRTTGPS
jgi:hypothetical protein